MKDDAISRQGVLKLLSTIPPEETTTKAMLIQSVKQMDAAQPEIIRCRDCKYNDMPPTAGNAGCTLLYGMTNQNGFCSLAERREVNETDG